MAMRCLTLQPRHLAGLCLVLFLVSCAPFRGGNLNPFSDFETTQPIKCKSDTVLDLAMDLDELETHIERHGSVVAMQPSVWGEARLTRHREEFERTMLEELKSFTPTIQASLSRTDQAFLANSFALSAAVTGTAAVRLPPRGVVVNNASGSSSTGADIIKPTEPKELVFAHDLLKESVKRAAPTVSPDVAKKIALMDQGIGLEPTVMCGTLSAESSTTWPPSS